MSPELGTAVAEHEATAVVTTDEPTVSGLVQLAIDKGVDVEVLERLVALQERVTERQAEQSMNDAIRNFQEAVPLLQKSRTAKIATRSGSDYSYTYAPLSEIVTTIRPILVECGLSYTWDSEADDGQIRVTCWLYHTDGARRSATFTGPTASKSGASEIQKVGAALTYGQRQSLKQVLGLTQADDDTDAAQAPTTTTISQSQLADLTALYDEVKTNLSSEDETRYFAFFGVTTLAEIPADRYAKAVSLLEAKR